MANKSIRYAGSATGGHVKPPRAQSPQALGRDDDELDGDDVRWRFHRTGRDEWRWQKIVMAEGVNHESSAVFPSYRACQADAQSAGYTPLLRRSNLVTLTLSADPQPVPALLGFDAPYEEPSLNSRSPVLKKRVAHPAIERSFGKGRAPASTRKRTPSSSRAALPAAAKHAHLGPRIAGKIKISRA